MVWLLLNINLLAGAGIKQLVDNSSRMSLALNIFGLLFVIGLTSGSVMHDMRPEGEDMTWDAYNRLSSIHKWMSDMAKAHPKEVSVMDIGRSTMNNSLLVMKISFPEKGGKVQRSKPAVFIEGGIHAREWISPAAVTYIANHLISSLAPSIDSDEPFRLFDWYFVPVMNPDGYEYTTSSLERRLWRKSMSGQTSMAPCFGVDLNRNFDFQWNSGTWRSASTNICAEDYKGRHAASEPEVRALQSFLIQHSDSIKLYVGLHAYSQLIMFPWAYSKKSLANFNELMRIGKLASKSMKQLYKRDYIVGQVSKMLYEASGTSVDYAKGVAGIDYTFTIELRPDQTEAEAGWTGFHLRPEEIVEAGEEALAAVGVMATEVAKNLEGLGEVGGTTTTVSGESSTSSADFVDHGIYKGVSNASTRTFSGGYNILIMIATICSFVFRLQCGL